MGLAMTRPGVAFRGPRSVGGHCLSSVLSSQSFAVERLASADLMIVSCNSGRLLAGEGSTVLLNEGSWLGRDVGYIGRLHVRSHCFSLVARVVFRHVRRHMWLRSAF